MKRFVLLVLLFAVVTGARASEEILSYTSDIEVFEDASVLVTESIRVRAEGREIRRGIYRDFSTTYADRLGRRYRVGFQIVDVTRDGSREAYHTESRGNGVRIYIGREDHRLDPGVYTYTLTYRTTRQLGFFSDHDELYWNVTGNGWAFPILEVGASVRLPSGIAASSVSAEGYTGYAAEAGSHYRAVVDADGVARFTTTRALAPKEGFTLVVSWPKGYVQAPGRGEKAAWFLRDNAPLLIGVFGLAVLLAYYLVVWHRHGRDPQAGVVFPRYEPPPGYSPASMRFIRRMGYDHKAFCAALVNLAVKGLIDIDETDKHFVLRRTNLPLDDLAPGEKALVASLFLSTKPSARKTQPLEQLLAQVAGDSKRSGLVPRLLLRIAEQGIAQAAGASKQPPLADSADPTDSVVLERKNHSRIRAALKAHENALKGDYDKIYFRTNRSWIVAGVVIGLGCVAAVALMLDGDRKAVALFVSLWLAFWSIGVMTLLRRTIGAWRGARSVLEWVRASFATLFAVPFVLGEIVGFGVVVFAGSPVVALVLAGAVAINFAFYQWLKAPTRAGRELLDYAEGFRLFLNVAEKDEMNLRHPPEKTPELFERYLPHALALDVENQWAERFAELFQRMEDDGRAYRPRWYHGRRFSASDMGGFSSSIGGSLGSAIASASTAPGSSSGAGGGGSSGGGGGGGGGGGW